MFEHTALIVVTSIILDNKIASKFIALFCSDNTLYRRTAEIAADIIDQVMEKIVQAEQSALRLDEVSYFQRSSISVVCTSSRRCGNFRVHLIYSSQDGNTAGRAIFQVISDIFS